MKRFIWLSVILVLLSPLLFSYEYIMNASVPCIWDYVDTQITTLTGGDWDSGYFDLALPADNQFYFYGKKVTHIRIWTNGYVTFGFGSAPTDYSDNTNDPIPSSSNPQAYAAPWWDDWDLSISGEMWYRVSTFGPSSNNWVTIEWRNVAHKYDATSSYTFQIILFGRYLSASQPFSRNCIYFSYQDTDSGAGGYDYGISGTVGIEHYTGWQCEKYSYNTVLSISNSQSILFTPFIPIYDTTDHWGDGKPDLSIFRPSEGKFYLRKNDGSSTDIRKWGTRGDVPLDGDYDGDGDADWLVFRPSDSKWYCEIPNFVTSWGTEGDIPVSADFDGDGWSDLCVFRPKEGKWYINYRNGGTAAITWGTQGDIPVPADYDNDGQADVAVYRPSDNKWYIRKSSNPSAPWVIPWGTDGDIPFPANFQTSAYSTMCVYRPSDGRWYSYNQNLGSSYVSAPWGAEYDHAVPNDWNAGSITDSAVFRPSDGKWYVRGMAVVSWGALEDKPRCRRSFAIVSPNPSGEDENKY